MGRNLEQYIIQNFTTAIERHMIQTFYQPVIRTSSRQLCSFEALARWIDPELGVIYPDEFIPVLERERLIHLLDTAILRQVCARLRSSIANGETPIPVSVNLSRLDFTLCDIFSEADRIVSEFQIPHDFLYFEITESIVAEQKELMMGIVERFRSAGYQMWMDDFGSAYSSLNVLKDFSFDELKLDMSFLRPFNLRSKRIVTALVKMAKEIYVHTLAEGVETEEQFVYLRDIGCEKVQGYYFGKPMPYEDALANLRNKGIRIEALHDRNYYDEIGQIDYLSAVPFMTREEQDSLVTARQLNSIPLMLADFSADSFRVLFFNTAFEKMARQSGMFAGVFTQEMLGQPQPYRKISTKIINLMDSARVSGQDRMLFAIKEQYYEIKARLMAQARDKYCVLVRVTNLTKEAQSEKTGHLDENIRQIYALYDRITLLNYAEDSITPLYTDAQVGLISGRQGIQELVKEYAEKFLYPDDRTRFIRAFHPEAAKERLMESASVSFSELLRTSVRHGQYAWTKYTLLKIDENNALLLIQNIHDCAKKLIETYGVQVQEGGPYAPAQLWSNIARSELLRIFWKDRDRRFLGASKAFLDFYNFSSLDDILGKNDEEMGWHVHPDLYMNDEYKVIHEGMTFHNVPGNCICNGENREIMASKTPLYDVNGEISGLIGYFFDITSLGLSNQRNQDATRRDLLTGLLNSRGISEEAEAFHDEFYLRGTDFVRIHITINDFTMFNEQYGFDFGDKVLGALGRALKQGFGRSCAVGRYAGHTFAILQQVESREDARRMREKVKNIGQTVREVDGRPITLYLSVGFALYSETLDLTEQVKSAEMRLHADYDQNISDDNRIDHASALFHFFDDLPVPYTVFHVTYSKETGQYDVVFFYVNSKYEEFAELPAKAMLGHTVRELFPYLGDDWYYDVKSAALDGKLVEGEFDSPLSGKHYRFTARQIIYPGYCAITCVETPVMHLRKTLLIADDIESNREILGELLSDDYDILYAADGEETLEQLHSHSDEISLLILDLYMPKLTGRDVLRAMKADAELMEIPVIVLTVDLDAELDCLRMGALDFIPKPYPDIEIVKARIAKCIELSENRDASWRAHRDKLTRLFKIDYFMQIVKRWDQEEPENAFDALVFDVNRFSVVNQRYGRPFGDLVLRGIGVGMKNLIRKTGGMGCRKGDDTFLFYAPHQDDWEPLLREFLADVFAETGAENKTSLRIGVYPNAHQEHDIAERFVRANYAADSVKNVPHQLCGYYQSAEPGSGKEGQS